MELKFTEEQFSWLVSNCDKQWAESTIEMFRRHYVEGIPRKQLVEEHEVTKAFISSRFGQFETAIENIIKDQGLTISSVIHIDTDLKSNNVRKLDISSEGK